MLRFEDKIGSEEIYKRAEKDLNTLVKNNETRTVKNCRTTTIHVDDTKTVETGNATVTVQQGNQTITVKQNITTESQSGNVKLTVDTTGELDSGRAGDFDLALGEFGESALVARNLE